MPTLITTAGSENANSYATLADANTYHSDRGHSAWSDATDTQRETALIKATDYLDTAYVFKSVRSTETQSLENPRFGDDGISTKVITACSLLALSLLSADPYASQPEDRAIKTKESLEGVGSQEVEYATTRADPYPFVTKTLRGVANRISAEVGTITMVRP